MAVTTTNLGVITAYGDAVAAGYTGTKAEWQTLMASYATVGQQAVDAKNAAVDAKNAAVQAKDTAVAAKDTATSKATEATKAANTATTKANEASASAQSIAESAAQIQKNTDDIDQLKSDINYYLDTNIFQSATFQQGAFQSVSNFSNTTINAGTIRIYTQITLNEPLPREMTIAILNNSCSYECGLFDADGNNLGFKSNWVTEDWHYAGENKIKYIRLNIRNNDNSDISEYLNQIGGFPDAFVSLKNAYYDSIKINNLDSLVYTNDSITWNQLAPNFNRPSGTIAGVTYTKSADGKTITLNGTANATDNFQLITAGSLFGRCTAGHKYICISDGANGSDNTYWFYFITPDAKDYGYGVIWEPSTDRDLLYGIYIKKYAVFDNLTMQVPIIADLTAMFGAGKEPTIEEFRVMFPNKTYKRDTGTSRYLTRMEQNALNIYENSLIGESIQNSVKLKILSFNLGNFNYGLPSHGNWTGDELTEKINLWKQMLAKYKPDIILAQELSQYFDFAETINAVNTIFKPLLPNYYFRSWTGLLSKIPYTQTWQEDVTVTVDGTTISRSFATGIIKVNGVDILICSVHLIPGYSSDDTAVREAMRDKLITAFSNYPYVILGGDFNESTDSFFAPFESAGYSLLNHGYFGTIETLHNESVDNIIVKGFAFYDVACDSADKCTSDHYPIASEMHII